jgi:hypothetical protein
MIKTPNNLIPLKIQNLMGNIYQVVSTTDEEPFYQGTWRQCAEWINEKMLIRFKEILTDGIIPPNGMLDNFKND